RVAEVADVAWPKLLDPVDDLPPATVITHIRQTGAGRIEVRGVASDNGGIQRVLVNGQPATALAANFAEWEAALDNLAPGDLRVTAHAEDAAGNVEPRGHVVEVRVKAMIR